MRSSLLFGFTLFFLGSELLADSLGKARKLMQREETRAQAMELLEEAGREAAEPSRKEAAEFLLAECEYLDGDPERAFWILDGLARGASNDTARASAYLRLAMLQMEEGMHREGMDNYENLARLFPESEFAPMAIMVQANYWLLVRGEKNRAISIYEEVASRYPQSEEGRQALALLPQLKKLSTAQVRNTSRTFNRNLRKERRARESNQSNRP